MKRSAKRLRWRQGSSLDIDDRQRQLALQREREESADRLVQLLGPEITQSILSRIERDMNRTSWLFDELERDKPNRAAPYGKP